MRTLGGRLAEQERGEREGVEADSAHARRRRRREASTGLRRRGGDQDPTTVGKAAGWGCGASRGG
jgi:hypothetical protein